MDLLTYTGTSAVVTGPPAAVRADLERAHQAGRLALFSPPTPVGRGQVQVHVKLHPLAGSRPRPAARRPAVASTPARPRWLTGPRVAIAVTTVAALGLLAWLVVTVLAWIAAHWALVLAVLFAAAVLLRSVGHEAVHVVVVRCRR